MTHEEMFDAFWAAYPARRTESGRMVKLHKKEARDWFAKHKPDDAMFAAIMQGVDAMTKHVDCLYYPDAFRWLRHERWEDEYDLSPSPLTLTSLGKTYRELAKENRDSF